MSNNQPFISIFMPALNEEQYIRDSLLSLIGTGYPHDRMEIIVADGGSSDRTREVVEAVIQQYPFVRLIENPERLQSAACNAAARVASPRSEYFIRVDAHSKWSEQFLPKCLETALGTKADLVVFVNAPRGITPFQQSLAYALSHPLGVGNSLYRLGHYSGWVDHGQHGCFTRTIWEKTGGYRILAGLQANEDVELSFRVAMEGGKIWLQKDLRMTYYPRKNLSALSKQYFHYGIGRYTNHSLHHRLPSFRQILPPAFVIGLLILVLLIPLLGLLPIGSVLAAYSIITFLPTIMGIIKTKNMHLWRLLLIFPTIQLSWGAGFIVRMIQSRSASR